MGAVAIRDGSFTWDTTAEKATLQDINLDARPGGRRVRSGFFKSRNG